jgi:hypothetical protein
MADEIETVVDPIVAQALNGVPQFYDIPDELRASIEQAVMQHERMFWLRSADIPQGPAETTLLRRAIYAEQRCWEMENRLAEVSLIAQGMKERIEDLENQLTVLAGHTS